jgi:hypothetical protein
MYRCFIFFMAMVLTTHAFAVRKRHHTNEPRASASERDDSRESRQTCLDRVRGLGTQWIGEQGALDAARKDWMERVRYYHGETFLDLSHGKDFVKRCGRVSIGEVAGQVLYRCEIEARPCKASFAPVEGEK